MDVEYFRDDNKSISSIRSKIEKMSLDDLEVQPTEEAKHDVEPPNEDY